ncbi:YceI family protein [Candidatus Marinimicrobia bacterium]|nr:YceI family protein [Candidatus Neomarinimicrobiota bacterium]
MKKILLILCIISIPLTAQSANEKEVLKSIGTSKQIERSINLAPKPSKHKKMGRDITLAQSIKINKRSSILEWKGGLKFVNNDHNGNLKIKGGSINLQKDNKITGNIVINMMSMTNIDLPDSRKDYLIGHLRSEDFFHVDRYPIASLEISSSKILEKKSDGKYNMQISGDLTVKSTTKPIIFTALVDLDSDIKSATGTMEFNRTDFDVQYRSEMHLDDAKSFWNKLNTTKEAVKDKVIQDKIEVMFNIISLPGVLER